MTSVVEFSKIEEFDRIIALAMISPIPRWGFAQSMESRIEDPNRPMGVALDVAKFVELTRKILSGEDLVAEFVIKRFESTGTVRAKAWTP